jgi:hypothetical protein
MTEPLYRIAKWETVFERAESRKLKQLNWVPIPVGFSSSGYQQMIDDFGDRAPAIYGAWCALVSLAASCTVRGTLGNGRGIPLKVSHIARMTMFPESVFVELIKWAASDNVRWLIEVKPDEIQAKLDENNLSGESPDDLPASQEKGPNTRHNITRQDTTTAAACGAAAAEGFFDGLDFGVVASKAARLASAIPRHHRESVSREFIWQVCVIAEVIGPCLVTDWVARLKVGDIKSPKSYLNTAMRLECERVKIDFKLLRAICPPAPPPEVPQLKTVGQICNASSLA